MRAGVLARLAAVAAAPACLMGSIVGAWILAQMALHPARKPSPAAAPAWIHLPAEDVAIRAEDGVQLEAWYFPAPHRNGSGVVLLHGMADNREGVAGYAFMFLQHGYSVLLPDSRAHGASGGAIAT
jgi:uncharacterized protein